MEPPPEDEPSAGFEPDVVLAQIADEVRHQRRTGALTPEFERHLEVVFDDLAPPDATIGDLGTLLTKLDASLSIDTRAPTDSASRGVPQVKALVSRAIDWELRYVAGQVTSLLGALTRGLHLVSERLDDLEARTSNSGAEADATIAALLSRTGVSRMPSGPWADLAVAALAGTDGPVLHAECEHGEMVAALRAAGIDAYGVDPVGLTRRAPGGADLRTGDVRAHLAGLDPAQLGGLILSGCTDRLSVASLVDLVALGRRRLRPGSPVLVLAHRPGPPGSPEATLAEELAGRPPLRPETLVALLDDAGYRHLEVRPGPPPPVAEGTDHAGSGRQGFAVVARS